MSECCTVIRVNPKSGLGRDIRLCLPIDMGKRELDGYLGKFWLHLNEYEVVIVGKEV
jgi:hypothetical protein